ncbi:MAG: glycoside hydrolase family 16 protein, partial [Luteolibacter sp.]
MKSLAFSLLGIVTLAATAAPATAQAIPGRTLLWADEFSQADGTKPDSAKWGYDTGGTGWGNNELQNYTDRTENARIEGGQLVIEARKENLGGRAYTSARLLTRDKVSWTYGRIEARIKIPKGQGIWPAFWMLGTNIGSVGWPLCGEIDIMENIGSLPSTLYGTIHGPGYSGGGGISGNTVLAGAALGDDFHVYAIEWEENRIRWFLDGQQFFTLTPANLP